MRREANIEDWRVFCAIAKTGSIHEVLAREMATLSKLASSENSVG